MKTNSEIRQATLALMKGNWKPAVVVTLVYLLVVYAGTFVSALVGKGVGEPVGGAVQEILSLLVAILVIYPMTFSLVKLFLGFVRGEQQLHAGGVFSTFNTPYYGKSIGLYLLTMIFTFLWTLLLIVPGIIKSLSYALAPYILAENPELTANEAINRSMEMMKGHKMALFLIILGYAGFALLSILALGIPLLWIHPYYQAVFVKFYEEVKAANK
jgi:uncharacterized membrane protein